MNWWTGQFGNAMIRPELAVSRDDIEDIKSTLEKNKDFIGAMILRHHDGEGPYSATLKALAKLEHILGDNQ